MDGQLPASRYAIQTFEGIDQFKWARIRDKVLAATGIDMYSNGGQGTGTHKGIAFSWSYSAETQKLAVDLVERKFYDPSEQTIDQMLAQWIKEA